MPEREKPEQAPNDAAPHGDAVDIERLADRVYRLMLAELRLERRRGSDMDP
jgi:hypothetical protein